jgi:hypothetical protein
LKRGAFDVAYGREPAPGITTEDRMRVYRDDLAARKLRAGWIRNDDEIDQRLRRMRAYAHAQASADSAEVSGPGAGLNMAQREAYRHVQEANERRDASGPLRGVPRV